jgi:hypothetical protein
LDAIGSELTVENLQTSDIMKIGIFGPAEQLLASKG